MASNPLPGDYEGGILLDIVITITHPNGTGETQAYENGNAKIVVVY